MEYQTHNIEICTDCLLFIANGELPEESNPNEWSPDDVDQVWPGGEGWHISLGHYLTVYPNWHDKAGQPYDYEEHNEDDFPPSDPEPSFSRAPCGACDSHLGGDRHAACAQKKIDKN